jgi:hypothetical protein
MLHIINGQSTVPPLRSSLEIKNISFSVFHILPFFSEFKDLLEPLCFIFQSGFLYGTPSRNVSTTPLRQWGFLQCLPFSWTTLRGKHCRHPIAVMGVVDTFRHNHFQCANSIFRRCCLKKKMLNWFYILSFFIWCWITFGGLLAVTHRAVYWTRGTLQIYRS